MGHGGNEVGDSKGGVEGLVDESGMWNGSCGNGGDKTVVDDEWVKKGEKKG